MSEYKSIAGRNCAPAPIAISLHRFVGSLPQLEGYIGNCLNKNRPSYNYGIEGCKLKAFVPVADTAYAIPYPVCPVPQPPACPVILPECSTGVTALDGFTGNPNCKVISIAVVGGLNNANICDVEFDCTSDDVQCLAKALKQIAIENGITLDATTLLTYGFDDFPICELLDCIATLVDDVVPPNPETVLLCQALSEFAVGVPVTVFGKDATGACVQGVLPTVSAPVISINVNTAVPQMEVIVNGAVVNTVGLVELTEALTGAHLGYIFP